VSWCEKKYSKHYLTIEFLIPGYCLIRNTTNYMPQTEFKYSYDGKTWFDSTLAIGMNDTPTQVLFDEPHSDYAFN